MAVATAAGSANQAMVTAMKASRKMSTPPASGSTNGIAETISSTGSAGMGWSCASGLDIGLPAGGQDYWESDFSAALGSAAADGRVPNRAAATIISAASAMLQLKARSPESTSRAVEASGVK